MESLSDEVWDVVIAGTSIPQSLLALALSRSDKKILHVDRHSYYGGDDAGLSLADAQAWAEDLRQCVQIVPRDFCITDDLAATSRVFKDASISRFADDDSGPPISLGPSRSYTLSLSPQIIYAKSEFLPSLVSSQIHTQLEFLAVGSLWVLSDGQLHKIPSTREDVFNDESLSMKDKRGLMKFLRYVMQEEETTTGSEKDNASISLKAALSKKFKIPDSLQAPLVALALSPVAANLVPFDKALARIRRHMRSMGHFGQGFGAVVAKYGGTAEIAQVACRAGAVGGGVYLLGHGLQDLDATSNTPAPQGTDGGDIPLIECTLSDGTRIRARYVVGNRDDIPAVKDTTQEVASFCTTWRSVNVIADPLRSMFPQTSDNGPIPAVAIILVDDGTPDNDQNPIYLQIHSEDTGECPAGQCLIYASVVSEDGSSKDRLQAAVRGFLETAGAKDSLLWSLSYRAVGPDIFSNSDYPPLRKHSQFIIFPHKPQDVAFDDGILHAVNEAWQVILGPEVTANSTFLRFEERESEIED
ncbi:uncharacterized protein Z519_02413 [Cladophialophora bantiana CBS 173.52]|uniref:Rab proteins geranylgeranyltransferase n=1 Tax=Cladophialophora bantiana (strain ATCC 10958 / CBS 173.52 / CDC B-1940 / NIH 8579) TaxID=1442370 RepID=A0A0D2F4B5_CLAB1|nr:uncharacterized protein Z519_02413 [Cladophialophora bantiana CBS 173.52]KIW97021.1 hypothetical protein Z519_02413 [Cladophialophora bantiana CBS 173.52]